MGCLGLDVLDEDFFGSCRGLFQYLFPLNKCDPHLTLTRQLARYFYKVSAGHMTMCRFLKRGRCISSLDGQKFLQKVTKSHNVREQVITCKNK